VRLPGISRSVNGPNHEAVRVAQEGDTVSEEVNAVSRRRIRDCRDPFGLLTGCDPREIPERLRKKLSGCARNLLRTADKRISRHGDAVPDGERES
jgi:hypothetical protein